LLEAVNLSKTYRFAERKSFFKTNHRDICAVEDISLKIEEGKIIGLLGVNGAGKTTTIKMLSTLIEPTSGQITFNGIDCVKNPFELKKRINMIAGGERNLYWRLSAVENLEYFGALYHIPKAVLKERIKDLIEMTDLKEYEKAPVETYSKGMKQRLQFARGLINDPSLLFLDEPTLGLDVPIVAQMHHYIEKIVKEQNKGILITTHYMAEAEKLCDYIYILNKGKVNIEGTPSEIINLSDINSTVTITTNKEVLQKKWVHIETESYRKLGVKPEVDEQKQAISIHIKKEQIATFLQVLIAYDLVIHGVEIGDPKLEDAILQMSGDVRCEK